MGRMRKAKEKLKKILQAADWENRLDEIASGGMENVGALFSFLLLEPVMRHRAAAALGATTARIAKDDPDAARNVIRRFIWQLSEESGNIGWGIPEAFAECLAASPPLAAIYHKILISHIMDLGFEDNYCDNDQLRRSCYWAVGRLLQARPEFSEYAGKWLVKGLEDKDAACRGMAAWALAQMKPDLGAWPALNALAESGDDTECEIFENGALRVASVSSLAREARDRL